MSDETRDSPQRQERLQEILLSYVEAVEAGRSVDPEKLQAAHPEFADDIAEFLAGYGQLNRMVTPLRTSVAPAELGQLGDFRLLRELGRGGMGVVYEAEQISLRRRVALKILPFAGGVDPRQLQRFRNEAEAAAHLHHSHIVPVFAVGVERGVHFYAMQHIEGQSLASLIADLAGAENAVSSPGVRYSEPRGSEYLTPGLGQTAAALSTEHSGRTNRFFQTVATLGKHVAEALEYAHQMGVVHRDVKPANLLLDAHGHVWVTDFGLAQFQNQAGLTISGEVLGTLRYVSPEQAMAKKGLVDHRTDIYSLGASLYELLTLKPVFDGKDRHALLHQIGFDEPIPPRTVDPSVPVELETIVLKALAKNPVERYGSAQELADDLQRFLDDKPILARRPTLVERARKWGRRHPSFVAAAVLLLVFGVVGFAVSTIVIAREQWKTQQAFDKLAIEEKRTKDANKDLADEQVRTEAALEAEARQRQLAEWDFEQARRALELVVQFSEGELAHHPGQQDVRRRLLLTVLDYYEEFLTAHEDDPAIQELLAASRERVALILTELSGLRGTTLKAIIQDANVQKDLAFNPEQAKQIAQFVNSPPPKMNPKNRPKGYESAAVEKVLGDILNAEQKRRFQQIVLQVQQQGRYGFSDPNLVETLSLTTPQRERIRRIQNDTHQAWADHLFTDKKIDKPNDFWADVQSRIMIVLEAGQREKWQRLTGPPVLVELREGYPWDGQNVDLPKGFSFPFPHPHMGRTGISVAHDKAFGEYPGSGFGHKRFFDDKQYYSWKGKEIPPTVFEIAVTAQPLTSEEAKHLVTKDSKRPMTNPDAPNDWVVLFRSQDPSVWNTESPDESRFAIPVARAPDSIRYLRLKRVDTSEMLIIPITRAELTQQGKKLADGEFAWHGSASQGFNARHLGIVQGPALVPPHDGPPGKDRPRKGPGKGPPPK